MVSCLLSAFLIVNGLNRKTHTRPSNNRWFSMRIYRIWTMESMHKLVVTSTHALEILTGILSILMKCEAIFKVINAHTFLEANKNPFQYTLLYISNGLGSNQMSCCRRRQFTHYLRKWICHSFFIYLNYKQSNAQYIHNARTMIVICLDFYQNHLVNLTVLLVYWMWTVKPFISFIHVTT